MQQKNLERRDCPCLYLFEPYLTGSVQFLYQWTVRYNAYCIVLHCTALHQTTVKIQVQCSSSSSISRSSRVREESAEERLPQSIALVCICLNPTLAAVHFLCHQCNATLHNAVWSKLHCTALNYSAAAAAEAGCRMREESAEEHQCADNWYGSWCNREQENKSKVKRQMYDLTKIFEEIQTGCFGSFGELTLPDYDCFGKICVCNFLVWIICCKNISEYFDIFLNSCLGKV